MMMNYFLDKLKTFWARKITGKVRCTSGLLIWELWIWLIIKSFWKYRTKNKQKLLQKQFFWKRIVFVNRKNLVWYKKINFCRWFLNLFRFIYRCGFFFQRKEFADVEIYGNKSIGVRWKIFINSMCGNIK